LKILVFLLGYSILDSNKM